MLKESLQVTQYTYVIFSYNLNTQKILDVVNGLFYKLEEFEGCKTFCLLKTSKKLSEEMKQQLIDAHFHIFEESS